MFFYWIKKNKHPVIWLESVHKNLKEIRAMGSELIVTQTTDKCRFYELCWHIQLMAVYGCKLSWGSPNNERALFGSNSRQEVCLCSWYMYKDITNNKMLHIWSNAPLFQYRWWHLTRSCHYNITTFEFLHWSYLPRAIVSSELSSLEQ